MNIDIITKVELEETIIKLKSELTSKAGLESGPPIIWLKSDEVLKIFKCSKTTLRNLRNEGKLPASKIRGRYYYSLVDIEKLFQENRKDI